MIDGKKVVAIIPARAGSKRLKNKNKLPINGLPMVKISVIEAINSRYIDEIILSTDDNEIIDMCRTHNIKIIKRPAELCTDYSTTMDVVQHCITSENLDSMCVIILLQPTSPLRNTVDIDSAIECFYNKNAESILSVCEVDHSPLWCNTLDKNNNMNGFISDEIQQTRSQDLEKYYRINGAIYITNVEQIMSKNKFLSDKNSFAFIMDKINSIDIDDQVDYLFACSVFNNKIGKRKNSEY